MRHATHDAATMPSLELDFEIDAEVFEERFDSTALAAIEASLEDVEPWQRLGDLLGRLTGDLDPE